MPGPYGVTPTGFNPKPLQEIKADLETAWRAIFGNGTDVSADSVDGQIIGIFSDRLADAWQALQATYQSAFGDSAIETSLDLVSGLTGTVRLPASSTTVVATLSGVPGTVVPAGSRASVAGAGSIFQLTAGVTIGGGGTISGNFTAVDSGPVPCPAGLLTVIETPVAGWASVTNPLDAATLGSLVETDPKLRQRRALALRQIGASALDAIVAAVANLTGVTYVKGFENFTEATVDSMPPRSFEIIVVGGDPDQIGQTVYDRKPAGQPAYGSTTVVAFDYLGNDKSISFSRPTAVPVYVTINVNVTGLAPDNVGTLIRDAVVAWGDLNLSVGRDVVAQAMVPTVFGIPGVDDCSVPKIGLAATPTLSATLIMTPRQQADLDTSRTVVNVTRI